MPRPKVPAEQIEARRRQALQLLEQGYSLNKVSRIVGAAPSSVMRWRAIVQSGGEEALKVRFSPGRPPSFSATERARFVEQLLRGATANGFGSDLWTTERVAIVIHRYSQARFHRSHVVRLMHDLGFKCQGSESDPGPVVHPGLESENASAGHRQKRLRGWVRVAQL